MHPPAKVFLLALVAAVYSIHAQTTPAEMRRITGSTTPAHSAAKKFRRGTNLGNYLEAPPGQDWGAKYTEADFVHIKAEGFDHVRLPIAWNHYAGSAPGFRLSDEQLLELLAK